MDQNTTGDVLDKTNINQTTSQAQIAKSIYGEILDRDILDLMGVGNLPENEKEELYKKMLDTIMNRVILRLDSQISDAEVDKMSEVVESQNQEGFFKFFEDKGIDIKKIFAEEAALYKVEMVALTSQGGDNAKS